MPQRKIDDKVNRTMSILVRLLKISSFHQFYIHIEIHIERLYFAPRHLTTFYILRFLALYVKSILLKWVFCLVGVLPSHIMLLVILKNRLSSGNSGKGGITFQQFRQEFFEGRGPDLAYRHGRQRLNSGLCFLVNCG